MKKNSLVIRTLVAFVLFSIIILSLLWFFQIQLFNIYYEKYQIKMIKDSAHKIENTNIEDLESTIEKIAYDNNICVQYYSESEIINYNTKNKICLLDKNNNNSFFKETLVNDENQFIKLQGPNGIKSIVYAVNLGDNNFVFLNTTLEDMSTATTLLKSQMFYISLIIIGLAIVLSLIISMQFNKPILKITDKAKEMGKGNYDVEFEESDIAELRELSIVLTRAASEMKATDEVRKDLLANVSHDLKTPLTMIKAYAEKVRDITYSDPEKRNKDLNVIIEESDRLNGLVNDLVEMSKIESKNSELNIEQYDLKDEITEVMKRYSIVEEKEKYIFNLNIPDKKLLVNLDRKKMDQVFYNLINNAIEHTGKNKTIDINVDIVKNKIMVSIKDYGKGIKKEEIPLVWNRYYTKSKRHRRNTIGSGIGLSIVKDVFEKHKLEYGIDSKENEYTIFYFKIDKCKK